MPYMRKISVIVSTAALLCWSSSASSVTTMGDRSCGNWVRPQQAGNNVQIEKLALENWLVGFLSGMAVASKIDVLEHAAGKSLYVWMDKYCQANPLNRMSEGALELFIELNERRGR